MAQQLVIVGSGMAGGKLVEEVLAGGRPWDITIIGDEPEGNYNRIKLNYCLGDNEPDEFWLNPPSWYVQHGVSALLGHPVTALDRIKKTVSLANGRIVPYNHLVLATGSRPFIPTLRNGHLPTIMAIRNLADVHRAKPFLAPGKRVIVVGGGLLGLELALMLKERHLSVTVSQFMPTLMETQLDEDGGRVLQSLLETDGLSFVMNTFVTGVDPVDPAQPEGAFRAVFKSGQVLEADVLLVSTGIRPNIDLAKAAGLECQRGVKVDHRMTTTDPSISAIGECIEFEGRIWGLVAPAYEQARILAVNLSGGEASYTPGLPGVTHLKSTIPVISMGQFSNSPPPTGATPTANPGGPVTADIETVVFHDPGRVYKKLLVKEGRLLGAVLVGDDLNADTIALHYSANLPVPERRSELLFPNSGTAANLPDPSFWPDALTVCDCNGVSTGKLRKAINDGADTLGKLMSATKAGTGCGNCKGKLKALLLSELGELKDDPSERWFVPGIPLERPDLERFILGRSLKSVSAVLETWPNAKDDAKTRNGLDFLLNYLYCGDYTVEDDSRTANDRYSGNIQKDGRFSVIPNMPAGLATPAQLRALAAVAEEYHAEIKVTGADRIGLYALRKEDLPTVWDKLQMGSGHAFTKTFRACKACVGSKYCRYGLADSLHLGERLNQRYRGIMGPAKFKMGVSGCPRNCSEATIKDFGVIAGDGGWDLYIAGNGGAALVAAKHLVKVKTDDEVVRIADRFYQYYRRHARFGERSAPFVERIGFEIVSGAVLADWPVEGPDGKPSSKPVPVGAVNLENDMARVIASYRDPWNEARRPPAHFGAAEAVTAATSLTPIGEPQNSPSPERSQPHEVQWDRQANTAPLGAVPLPAPTPAGTTTSQVKADPLPLPRGPFKALLAVSTLPRGGARAVSLGSKRVAVFHGRDDSWMVCDEACPHERGPLVDGIYGNGRITCTIHQYSWNAKTGQCDQPACGDLRIYRTEIKDGYLWAVL